MNAKSIGRRWGTSGWVFSEKQMTSVAARRRLQGRPLAHVAAGIENQRTFFIRRDCAAKHRLKLKTQFKRSNYNVSYHRTHPRL